MTQPAYRELAESLRLNADAQVLLILNVVERLGIAVHQHYLDILRHHVLHVCYSVLAVFAYGSGRCGHHVQLARII